MLARAKAPLTSGVQLTVGAERNSAATIGEHGREPWFRTPMRPYPRGDHHEIDLRKGVFVYRCNGKEVFRRSIRLDQFPGRRIVLWSRRLKPTRETYRSFDDIRIVTRPVIR